MQVAIDGPAGAGKSTVSRRLAAELGFAFLDTGALYRAVALAAQRQGMDPEAAGDLTGWLATLAVEARPVQGRFVVTLDGQDVEPHIRNEVIGELASKLSARPEVRAFLLGIQQAAGQRGDLVAEGRDTGTIVFPEAKVKIFLTAELDERARRRLADLRPQHPGMTLEQVRQDIAGRDRRDQGRSTAPLAPAPDALVLDTTDLSQDQVVTRLLEIVSSVGSP